MQNKNLAGTQIQLGFPNKQNTLTTINDFFVSCML